MSTCCFFCFFCFFPLSKLCARFHRLRPLLIKGGSLTNQPIHTLYHGEKYLLELTTKLRKNNVDILRTTQTSKRLVQIKAAAAVGSGRSNGSNGGNSNRGGGGVCFGFRDTGSCKHGDSCKFSHDSSSSSSSSKELVLVLDELKTYERTRETIRHSMIETIHLMETATLSVTGEGSSSSTTSSSTTRN